ncbi:TlpA family protein disulfide reductase [Solihabitans fulvus]|uniref:TlpA family protein disulfide reductase n=1 Tax=Solihabitans fulvus TaxID=1892852 RepID=A0A5B2XNM1_9PSEU|nr:TlpA disulfide reductase family protein [Solihabitans fulvus]KAA2264953.1 TlpA family protein disulfide reductase [Solihabitans fulvus]
MLALAGCSTGQGSATPEGDYQFVAPNGQTKIHYDGADRKPAPPLSGDSLMEEGKQISLADFQGKVVVLNLWGTWCGPCRAETPELQKVYDQTKASGVEVLGINVKDPQRTAAQDFVKNRGLTYPSVFDESGRALLGFKGYPRSAVPSTIVLDRQHRVAAVFLVTLLADDLLPTVQALANEK